MTKKVDMNSQFGRMKQLMNYGLNESKKQPYSGVEYSRVAADGKMYGIIREGTKYYIKVTSKKDNVLAENFDYIGGFRNRKDHEYTSFASAQKNFDFKMRSIAEAQGKAGEMIFESWNIEGNENLAVESTNKMKNEIRRERQIMENTSKIFNKKEQSAVKPISETKETCKDGVFCKKADKEYSDTQKPNIKGSTEECGDAKKANDNLGYKKTEAPKELQAEGKMNEEEVLGWNRGNDDYMDKSHGTEIGSSMPFDDAKGKDITGKGGTSKTGYLKQGTVEEGASMHDSDNQNTPSPGVGEIGDNEPFNGEMGRQIDEAIDDLGSDADLEDGDDLDTEDGSEVELILDDDDEGFEDEGLEDRVASIEDKVDQILDALGGGETYEDDDLYDDEGDDEGFDEDGIYDDDVEDEDFDDDDFSEGEEDEVYESKAYRAMKLREAKRLNEAGMTPFKDAGRVPSGNMNKLNDFGKHPAYQKQVMSLPPKDMQEFPGYYDMNDDSVYSDAPYGEKIGDGAPFEVDPESITNAISESILKVLKKKN